MSRQENMTQASVSAWSAPQLAACTFKSACGALVQPTRSLGHLHEYLNMQLHEHKEQSSIACFALPFQIASHTILQQISVLPGTPCLAWMSGIIACLRETSALATRCHVYCCLTCMSLCLSVVGVEAECH